MKNNNTNKGITLIALVITIIVMLILVAVTISMAVNGGLFEYAGKATGEMQNAIDVEQQLADGRIQIGGVWYESIDHYLTGNLHKWTRSGDTFTCSHCEAEYTMGEVVDYVDAGAASATLTAEKSGLDRYHEAEGEYPEFAIVDENGNQTIEAQDVNWVVLGIEDTDKDGEVYETLLITTESDLWKVDEEDNWYGLYFYGAAAYNNGPDEINRICKELYSNSEYGEARGITIEDVNSALDYTPPGGTYMYSIKEIRTTGDFTTKLKELPTDIWNNIKGGVNGGTKTPNPTDTDTAEDLGEYELNGYMYWLGEDGLSLENDVNTTTSAITTIEKNIIFGSDTDYNYWLASRGVYADRVVAYFGLGGVDGGRAYSYGETFVSSGSGYGEGVGFRPVVSLKSKLPEVQQ